MALKGAAVVRMAAESVPVKDCYREKGRGESKDSRSGVYGTKAARYGTLQRVRRMADEVGGLAAIGAALR